MFSDPAKGGRCLQCLLDERSVVLDRENKACREFSPERRETPKTPQNRPLDMSITLDTFYKPDFLQSKPGADWAVISGRVLDVKLDVSKTPCYCGFLDA